VPFYQKIFVAQDSIFILHYFKHLTFIASYSSNFFPIKAYFNYLLKIFCISHYKRYVGPHRSIKMYRGGSYILRVVFLWRLINTCKASSIPKSYRIPFKKFVKKTGSSDPASYNWHLLFTMFLFHHLSHRNVRFHYGDGTGYNFTQ